VERWREGGRATDLSSPQTVSPRDLQLLLSTHPFASLISSKSLLDRLNGAGQQGASMKWQCRRTLQIQLCDVDCLLVPSPSCVKRPQCSCHRFPAMADEIRGRETPPKEVIPPLTTLSALLTHSTRTRVREAIHLPLGPPEALMRIEDTDSRQLGETMAFEMCVEGVICCFPTLHQSLMIRILEERPVRVIEAREERETLVIAKRVEEVEHRCDEITIVIIWDLIETERERRRGRRRRWRVEEGVGGGEKVPMWRREVDPIVEKASRDGRVTNQINSCREFTVLMKMKMDVSVCIREVRVKRARVIQDETVSIEMKEVLVARKEMMKNRVMTIKEELGGWHIWKNV
jgi:hypothetical protein